MAEAKEYIVHSEAGGSINISEEVVAVIAATALLDVAGAYVPGATKVNGSPSLDRKHLGKVVKLNFDQSNPDCVSITCSLLVTYGSVILDVATAVQNTVKDTVEGVTGLKVTAVDVNVYGISFQS